jgi:hypothetical protein
VVVEGRYVPIIGTTSTTLLGRVYVDTRGIALQEGSH